MTTKEYIEYANLPDELTISFVKLSSGHTGRYCACCGEIGDEDRRVKLTIGLKNKDNNLIILENKKILFYLCESCEIHLTLHDSESKEPSGMKNMLQSLTKRCLSGITKNFKSIEFEYIILCHFARELEASLDHCEHTIELQTRKMNDSN